MIQKLQNDSKFHYSILLIILVLSAYTHLWNPIGFPDIFFDEGIYMRRAMNILETGNPQEAYFYDHPYFGQIVLAGFLKIMGFPQTVEHSLEMSYLVPRILMGLFAVLDTILVYKIAEKRFDKKVAILASLLFAVMPITWLLRRILLDSILLPLLLSSILLSIYTKESPRKNLLIFGSSILLGLAIFTKITAVTMIPIVGYIILTNTRNLVDLIKWIPTVFLIPTLWPLTSIYLDHFEYWIRDVFWQVGRSTGDFITITGFVFNIDPLLIGLGFLSFAFALFKRNLFLIFWFAPFLLFVTNIGFFQYFHFILLLPVFCISIAFMLTAGLKYIKNLKLQIYIYIGIILFVTIFGIISTSILINTDVSYAQFNVMELILNNFNDTDTTLLSSPVYSWIFLNVFDKDNVKSDYSIILLEPITTKNIILIADPHFIMDINRGDKLQQIYNELNFTKEVYGNIEDFDTNTFPFTSRLYTHEGKFIELKTNRDQIWIYP